LYRVLDARPKLFLHPIAGDEHLDPGKPKISFFEVGGGITALEGANRIETEVRQEPRAGDEDLGRPARVVWHGATINGSRRLCSRLRRGKGGGNVAASGVEKAAVT
jgi:hypothetical protein